MSAKPPQLLVLPGEDRWEKWRWHHDGKWKQEESGDSMAGGIQALPMLALDSSPFPALTPQGSAATLEATVGLRWGALGADPPSGGCHWVFWQVAKEGDLVLTATLALAGGPQDDRSPLREASAFEPSVLLYPIPAGSIAVWKELGRYVVAFMLGDQLLHAAVLAMRELDQGAAHEIRDLTHVLALNWPMNGWTAVHLWTDATPEFVLMLQRAVNAAVQTELKPAPRLPVQSSGLLPSSVARERRQRLKLRMRIRYALAAAALMVLGFASWGGWLLVREQRVAQVLAEVQARRPQVEEVREAQLQWWALEAATDRDMYPLTVFREIVALLPAEGIRFKEFSMDREKVVVSGEATSLIHASKFQSDLKACGTLHRFAFNAPQPTILEDNRANFRVEGSIQSAVSPEVEGGPSETQ